MFKISFSINNIQNTLQRHYCRGQTVLSLEQNVLEDRDEIKKKVFRENHQNNYNSLTRILLWSKDLFWSKVKIATFFFNWNSPKRKKCCTRSNQISSFVKKKDQSFIGRTTRVKPYCPWLKFLENIWNRKKILFC